jgi:ribonuclease BN (tRNA processing enzyme)
MTDSVRVTFLGTADAFNAGGRAHSAYWVDDPHGRFVVDFGPTALMRCKALGLDVATLDAVYVTHLHGDHIGGLGVLFADLQWRVRRTAPLTLAGPAGTLERTLRIRDASYPSLVQRGLRFPLRVVEWRVPGEVEQGGRRVRAIRARHDPSAVPTSFCVETAGRRLAFSGDTAWQPALADLSADADLFVCECTEPTPVTGGHIGLDELHAHRDALTPRRLVLTHLSDETRPLAVAQAAALRATVADDGLVIEL